MFDYSKFLAVFKKDSILFFIAVVILTIQRIIHLSDVIMEPHMWRQADTFFYAFDFYNNGFNILRPSVCWLGSYKTLILEFPLVSWFMALFFPVLGPKVVVAKIISLIIFFLSALFLFKIIKYLYYQRLAKLTTLVYLMLPLGLNYSIAIHIDFGALLFTLLMVYYFLRGVKEPNIKYFLLSSFFGVLAFIIKSPYAFYTYIPLIYFAFINRKNKYFSVSIFSLFLPLIALIFWQFYTLKINLLAPGWFFIPDYFKFTNMANWYFGTLEQRLMLDNWIKLFYRLLEIITGYLGFPLFIGGFFFKLKGEFKKSFFNIYSLGLLIYLLVFFNLNVIHDYYQIPFLVISSFYIAVSIDHFYVKYENRPLNKSLYITAAIITLLMINFLWFAQNRFYKVDRVRKETSEILRINTEEDDLIISSMKETDARDPRVLAPAFRKGWSVNISYINQMVIDSLKKYGANYLAVTVNTELNDSLKSCLRGYNKKEFLLAEKNWVMYLYYLK